MRKEKLIIFVLAIVMTVNLGFSQSNEKKEPEGRMSFQDTINSPSREFMVVLIGRELGDNVIKTQYLLINTKRNETTDLMSTSTHDLPLHNFFWTNDNHLIYEYSGDYRTNCKIRILNIDTGENEFETEGFLPVGRKVSKSFYDKKNGYLFFFRSKKINNMNKIQLVSFNIRNTSIKELLAFDYSVDFIYEYPTIQLDTTNKNMIISYFDSHNGESCKKKVNY